MIPLLLTAFAASAATVFLLTPWVRRLAEAAGAIDKPDRHRKLHRRLVSLWGGLAIFPGLAAGAALALAATRSGGMLAAYRDGFLGHRFWILAGAGGLLLILGLLDDRLPLPPKIKILVQTLAAALAAAAGIGFLEFVSPISETVFVIWPAAGLALGILWLVSMTNAFNFIDGLDGLASGEAVICGLGLSLAAVAACHETLPLASRYQCQMAAVLAASAAGAGLGFWRFNRWPARIFLGEAGSSLLGFSLAAAGLLLAGVATRRGAPLAVLAILGWPILDTGLAVIRRLRQGHPVSKADHGHLHHRLVDMGFTHSGAAAFIHFITLILATAGWALVWL